MKDCGVVTGKAAGVKSRFAALDEKDEFENEVESIKEPKSLPPAASTIGALRSLSCAPLLTTTRKNNGVKKALATSWAALTDSEDEDDYDDEDGDDRVVR